MLYDSIYIRLEKQAKLNYIVSDKSIKLKAWKWLPKSEESGELFGALDGRN